MRDPYYATNAFYDALVKIDDYETMRITEAAQKVQRSGFPEAYEDHAIDARALASVLTGYSPGGLFTCVVHEPTETRQRRPGDPPGGARLRRPRHRRAPARARTSRSTVADSDAGHRLGWSVAQFVLAHGVRLHPRRGRLRRQAVARRPGLRGRLDLRRRSGRRPRSAIAMG